MAACLTEPPTPSFGNWVGPPNSSAIVHTLFLCCFADLLSLTFLMFFGFYYMCHIYSISMISSVCYCMSQVHSMESPSDTAWAWIRWGLHVSMIFLEFYVLFKFNVIWWSCTSLLWNVSFALCFRTLLINGQAAKAEKPICSPSCSGEGACTWQSNHGTGSSWVVCDCI